MYIQTEETPNPNAVKFLPGETVLKNGTMFINRKEDAARSPLAATLFKIANIEAVFLGEDFITVTKTPDALWEILKPMILTEIMDFYVTGQTHTDEVAVVQADESNPIVKQIKELIETRVRQRLRRMAAILFLGITLMAWCNLSCTAPAVVAQVQRRL